MNRRNALAVLAASPLLGLVPKKEAEGVDCVGYDVVPGKVCKCYNKTDDICPHYPNARTGNWRELRSDYWTMIEDDQLRGFTA